MHLLVSGPARDRNVFLACKDKKTIEFIWDAYLSLNWCSNVVQTWMKERDTASIWHNLLVYVVALIIGMSFFQLWVRFWVEIFSYCSVMQTFKIGFWNFFDQEWKLLQFSVGMCLALLTSYLHGLKSAKTTEMWFFTTSNFFDS